MDAPEDRGAALIRRNRYLLAVAAYQRGLSREARVRVYETWHVATEARRRAANSRVKSEAVRSREKTPG